MVATALEVRSTLGIRINASRFDAKDTSCLIDMHDQTTVFSVCGEGMGGNVASDNGLLRIDQVGNGNIDWVASGTKGSMFGFLVDSNFTENPLGYTDVPTGTINAKVVTNKCAAPSVFVTCDPYAAKISKLTLDVASDTVTNDAIYLKGVDGCNIQVSAPNARLRFDGVQNTYVRGQYSSYFESTFVDTRGAGTQSNTNLDLSFKGTWTPSVGGNATYNAANAGTYVRDGRFVEADFDCYLGTLGTGSVSTVSGLPITASTDCTRYAGSVAYFAALAVSPVALFPYVGSGTSTIQFDGLTAASNATAAQNLFGNGSRVIGKVRYRIV
jgi:hypothetical protein